MSIKFSPNDFLDLASDPSELPSTTDGKDEISGAMRRCTNLHLDANGKASTRKGSSKVNSTPIMDAEYELALSTPYELVEQSGNRYLFGAAQIYENEVSIKTGLNRVKWSAVKGAPFNSPTENIFALNGLDRKRIVDDDVYEWGLDAPQDIIRIMAGVKTGLTGDYNGKYTYARKEGEVIVCESNPSEEAAAAVVLANQSLRMVCEGPSDPQVTHIRSYRTTTGGVNYYHDLDAPIPTDADYAYSYDWEESDAYLEGTGYKFTENATGGSILEINDCDSLPNANGTWSVISGNVSISLDTSRKLQGTGSIKVTISSDYGIIAFTKATGSWDLSGSESIQFKIYREGGYWLGNQTVYFGEAFYNEQSNGIGTGSQLQGGVWTPHTWDISDIAAGSRDAVTIIAFKLRGFDSPSYMTYNIDYIIADTMTTMGKTHSWEPYETTDQHYSKVTVRWEPTIIDTDTADSSLGTEVATNHDRPPFGNFVFGPSLTGTYFILKDNSLYYSLPKQPEYWPVDYYLEVSPIQFPLKAGALFDGMIYVASAIEMYQIQGSGHGSWFPSGMSALCGTVSKMVFQPVHGLGIFHLGNDGLYAYTGAKDENMTNDRFKPIFEGTTVEDVPGLNKTYIANCWAIVFKNKLYFGYPTSGQWPDYVFVTDLKTGKVVLYSYGRSFPVVAIDYYNDRLLALDTSGYVWELENGDETDDDGTTIAWDIKSKDYSDQLRKYFPRCARYDLTLGDGATATGEILMNGVAKQSHVLSVSRKTGKRLVTGCTGDRIAIRISGTGPVEIWAAEVE